MKSNPLSKDDLVAVIIAGGSGTRFWPLSTPARPKQFLSLFGKRTMLQQTFDRLEGVVSPKQVLVLTSRRFVPVVRKQLPEIPEDNVIGEPVGRDTAGAVALAAIVCRRRFGNATMLVLPSDHVIRPANAFHRAVRSAAAAAQRSDALYTFGIPPTYPATGYGYLEAGERVNEARTSPLKRSVSRPSENVSEDTQIEHYRIVRFKEKPILDLAKEYVASGRYYWNSGMFVWTVDAILREIERHLPEHARHLLPLEQAVGRPHFEERLEAAFRDIPKISIDFGVMEKAERVYMVKAPFAWSDVGGWVALADYMENDPAGNAVRGQVHGMDAQGNIVYCADEGERVALVGVRDLIVIRADGRTLVARKDRSEDVKKLVEAIQSEDMEDEGRWTREDAPQRAAVVGREATP